MEDSIFVIVSSILRKKEKVEGKFKLFSPYCECKIFFDRKLGSISGFFMKIGENEIEIAIIAGNKRKMTRIRSHWARSSEVECTFFLGKDEENALQDQGVQCSAGVQNRVIWVVATSTECETRAAALCNRVSLPSSSARPISPLQKGANTPASASLLLSKGWNT